MQSSLPNTHMQLKNQVSLALYSRYTKKHDNNSKASQSFLACIYACLGLIFYLLGY